MSTETKNVENKSTNSLMRKTKAQLLEIILRKDEVERNLRSEFNELKGNLNATKRKLNELKDIHGVLKFNYEEECDEHSSNCKILENKVFKYKCAFIGSVLIVATLVAIMTI